MKMLVYALTAAAALAAGVASAADLGGYPPPRAEYAPAPPPVYVGHRYWEPVYPYQFRPYWRARYWHGPYWFGQRGWGYDRGYGWNGRYGWGRRW